MIKLPSGIDNNNLINDLRVFSWEASEILLKYSQILKDSKNKSNILSNDNLVGHNTDILGFDKAIKNLNFNMKGKKIFILGAGGVVPSIIFALKKMDVSQIIVSNRTKEKAENLKKLFNDIEIIDWGKIVDFDMIINATSIGLNNEDEIKVDFSSTGPNKFFYDVIYNPKETIFLKKAKSFGNKTENGKMMFIYQAHQAFTLWHKIMPKINDETIQLLDT